MTSSDDLSSDPVLPFTVGTAAAAPADQAVDITTFGLAESFLETARQIAHRLRAREEEFSRLIRTTERINFGVALDEILNFIYEEMRPVIPYDRIGFSLINEAKNTVTARWARSEHEILLGKGYTAQLKGSTLDDVLQTGRPRIINDLPAYLEEKPTSDSTRLVVREGMRASLTCPLIIDGKPVGFMFFSSTKKDMYSNLHIGFFMQIAGLLSSIVEKGRLYAELAEQKEMIENQNMQMLQELETARKVQLALIPEHDFDSAGLQIAFEYEPATQVGGDVLDFLTLDDNRILFFLGDAMGHGVQAALVMSAVKAALQSSVHGDLTAVAAIDSVNRTLERILNDQFVTAACCVMDTATGHAELVLGGHDKPLWYRADLQEIEEPGVPGLPLGVTNTEEFESTTFSLAPNDILVFCTDGLMEAFSEAEDQYGMDRLRDILRQHADGTSSEILQAMTADLRRHCGSRPMTDDLTLLVVKNLA